MLRKVGGRRFESGGKTWKWAGSWIRFCPQCSVQRPRRGFTLIELLVVITIILLVSAVALPVVLPALAHREVSEAARIVQASLAGARDSSLHTSAPSGIRLLPDPAFPLVYLANGQIDPTQPLAANRIIPIESAPEYTEGQVSVVMPNAFDTTTNAYSLGIPYPQSNGGGYYPSGAYSGAAGSSATAGNVLMIKEVTAANNTLNAPTSWFWNIRVGDKLQLSGSGIWYTVVGPMVVTPQQGNSELFVNVGPAGTQSPLSDTQAGTIVYPEFLFLVNGLDDNKNGWIDEGFDGVDNNLSFEVAGGFTQLTDDLAEWEAEAWPAAYLSNPPTNVSYTIQRRPAPAPNSREVSLPSNVVIDMTTWGNAFQERSQLPPGVINPFTGYVDILLYPNGTVVPTTIYSTPSSFRLTGAFIHLWLAERSDVAPIRIDQNGTAIPQVPGQPVFLPVGAIKQQLIQPASLYTGQSLKGEYRIVTLFTRSGQITTSDDVQFDNPMNPANGSTYNPGFTFLGVEQGGR
jgi:prepilin-type N-terminal cleavage/methylation domain-containing protein